MKPRIAILTGPTGTGKTELALKLAARLPLEIINADSLQVFRHLDIGSAKPTREQRKTVPHHLIDSLDPDAPAHAAWYSEQARAAIQDISTRDRIPLVVGGTGFYLRALEHPPTAPPSPPVSMPSLVEAYAEIQSKDPIAAEKIHPQDEYRVSRAFAVLATGVKPSEAWAEAAEKESVFRTLWLGLSFPRKTLYERIHRRVEEIFQAGLVEETEEVSQRFPQARDRLARSIGYREALALLEGVRTRDEAIERTKVATRQYAKRQLTWFRAEARMHWLEGPGALDLACRHLEQCKT